MSVYKNPVIPGFAPDPSCVRVGDDFFLVTSSFEFFPGVPVYHSRSLANWELVGYCLTDFAQLPLEGCRPSGGIFAPTLRHHGGTFYMTTTNTTAGGSFIVRTDDVCGKWSDPVFVDVGGIDPSLTFDGDKCYYVSTAGLKGQKSRRGIHVCEIDPDTGTRLTEPVWVSAGTGGRYPEGPHIYHIGGYWYLLLAEGGTAYGHSVTIQRSRDIYGPYEPCPHNPVLTHRDLEGAAIEGTGHADMFEDQNGNWWAVCLGFRPIPGTMLHHLGRETFLVPVTWEDGWPVFGDNGHVSLETDAPLPAEPTARDFDIAEDFTSPLSLAWNTVRNHAPSDFAVSDGTLTVRGRGSLSEDCGSPSFIGVRQQGFVTHTEVTVSVPDTGTAGLCAYYNEDYHYEERVTRTDGGVRVSLGRRLCGMEAETESVTVPPCDKVRLILDTDCRSYTFSVETDGGRYLVGSAPAHGLATEATRMMTFTGVYIGLFAEGGEGRFARFSLKVTE